MWWWNQKIHISWVIALSCTAFVVGVSLVLAIRVPWVFGLASGVALIMLAVWCRLRWAVPLIAILALASGLGYGSAHAGSRDAYAALIGQTVVVSGVLKEDFAKNSSGSASLQLESVSIQTRKYPGTILVSTRSPPAIKRSEIVYAEGIVKPGFGSFPIVLSSATVRSVRPPPIDDTGRKVRDWFAEKVRQLIPEPQASLGVGFLTGQKSALPEDLFEALKIAGLTHIVVASGYNLTILVRLARKLFKNASKYLSAVSSVAMIISFIAITGMSPSMTRAGIVSGISILSWYYGRGSHPLVLLPVVAAITVAFQPSYVWGDLGWQLSFSAFAGVMIVAPLLQHYFFGPKEPGLVRQVMTETVSAHLVTMPIIAVSFGTLSNVAILANLLVVPLVPIAMLLTFVTGFWAAIGLGLGWLIATPATWLLGYMTTAATYMSEFSWAQSTLAISGWVWLSYAALLCISCWWMWHATGYNFRNGETI